MKFTHLFTISTRFIREWNIFDDGQRLELGESKLAVSLSKVDEESHESILK